MFKHVFNPPTIVLRSQKKILYESIDFNFDPKHVYTLETGVPILLKGLLWPTKPRVDLLHRSPPTNGKEETRLIMVLDHVIDPEEEF